MRPLKRGVECTATFFCCDREWSVQGVLDAGFFFSHDIREQRCPECLETAKSYMVQDAPG